MATCSLPTLSQSVCADEFLLLDEADFDAVELQLLYNISGGSFTLKQLIAQACANGFQDLDVSESDAVELQLWCNISTGITPPPTGPVFTSVGPQDQFGPVPFVVTLVGTGLSSINGIRQHSGSTNHDFIPPTSVSSTNVVWTTVATVAANWEIFYTTDGGTTWTTTGLFLVTSS